MSQLTVGVLTIFLLLALAISSSAKTWRGITPLKSFRTDVERLFGKPNEFGRYETENERAYIFYSEGQCNSLHGNLPEVRCECLVVKDTVLRIAVTLETGIKSRGFNKASFERGPLHAAVPMSTYSDLDDGVVYTVRDSAGMITAIDYWPSKTDCEEVVRMQGDRVQRNVWRGIRPLHSSKEDVERILGRPKRQLLNQSYAYDTNDEKIDVLYSEGPCTPSVVGKWNVPKHTVLRITVHPQHTVLMSSLQLGIDKYERIRDPNIRDWFFWVNREEGVMIQSELKEGVERVMSITYSRSSEDRGLLCE